MTIDEPTRDLVRVLRQRNDLRAALVENERMMRANLRKWSDTRPGCRGGIATEAGARSILSQTGLL